LTVTTAHGTVTAREWSCWKVDRPSVTACNKQTDRRRASIHSLRAGWAVCSEQEH